MAQAKYIETQNLVTVQWTNITANQACEPHRSRAQPTLVAVQAEGVWGNASVRLLGSLSGESYVFANDMKQNPIEFSDNAAVGVLEPYIFWRPEVSGNAQTQISVTLAYWTNK